MKYDYIQLTEDILENKVKWEDIKMHHNNTYTFSKSLAEHHFLDRIGNGIIVRPSVIGPSLKYPVPDWNNSIAGIVGYYLSIFKGINKFIYINKIFGLNVVPVDIVSSKIVSYTFKKIENKRIFYAINNNAINHYIQHKIENRMYKNYSISNIQLSVYDINNVTYFLVYIWQFILRIYDIKYYKINIIVHNNYDYFTSNYWNFSNERISII